MKLETTLESISKILGFEEEVGLKASSADLFSTTLTSPVRVHQTFYSDYGEGQLPFVVIPAEFELDDFFATIATYYPSQTPLTAYVHVLGKDISDCFDPTQPNIIPDCHGLNRPQLARLGACLGETALAALSSSEAALNPSYSACKRSLGYALARTIALYPSFDANVILDRWERLRHLTGLGVSQDAVRAVCTIHAAAIDGNTHLHESAIASKLRAALVTHVAVSNANNELQNALIECYPRLSEIAMDNSVPFDARMGNFLRAVEEIQRSSQGAETDSLAVGYFCNRIQPGSFAHGKLLVRLIEFFPSVLVWYGMFCSTSTSFDARHFGSGLFEKLGRDMSQPFSFVQRPQCDLSLDELEVLMRAPVRPETVKPIQQKIASIALLPGLDIFSRFTPDDDSHGGRDIAAMKTRVSDERLTQATQLLDQAVSLLHQLGGQEGSVPPTPKSQRQRKR
jgi:hypothetical protein